MTYKIVMPNNNSKDTPFTEIRLMEKEAGGAVTLQARAAGSTGGAFWWSVVSLDRNGVLVMHDGLTDKSGVKVDNRSSCIATRKEF